MKLSEFDYDLPPERIAQTPARPRDSARMLVVAPDGMRDRGVLDLPAELAPGDLLVVNDTRVLPARLIGRRGEAKAEATLIKEAAPDRWRAFARPGKRLRIGDRIDFAQDFSAVLTEKFDGGEVELKFELAGADLAAAIRQHGAPPLPPYIKRPDGATAEDVADYQTPFAARDGAVAAPTASLHFTPKLLDALEARGVRRTTVTLHVGAGTFLPVKTEDVDQHQMHTEWGEVSEAAAADIRATQAAGGRVIAAGTTPLRILETAAAGGELRPFTGETDIFIRPGYAFRAIDGLMTNFHLPKSTLFMLVSALMGLDRMQAVYAHAIRENYRFFSYGDASLLLPERRKP